MAKRPKFKSNENDMIVKHRDQVGTRSNLEARVKIMVALALQHKREVKGDAETRSAKLKEERTRTDVVISQPLGILFNHLWSKLSSSGINAKIFKNCEVRVGRPKNSGPCADDSGCPPKVRQERDTHVNHRYTAVISQQEKEWLVGSPLARRIRVKGFDVIRQ